MVDEMKQGGLANSSGNTLERTVIGTLISKGAKEGSVNWLKNAAKNKLYTNEHNKEKNVLVLSLAEFLIWANNTFR